MKKIIANVLYLFASAVALIGIIVLIPGAICVGLAIGASTLGDRLTSGVWTVRKHTRQSTTPRQSFNVCVRVSVLLNTTRARSPRAESLHVM